MANTLTEAIRFFITKQDRSVLEQLCQINGDASMSATLRRLIRNEMKRQKPGAAQYAFSFGEDDAEAAKPKGKAKISVN